MKFGKIDHIIVLGGSLIALYFLKYLKQKKIKFDYFTSKRQLEDVLINNHSLLENLKLNSINYNVSKDINNDSKIKKVITKNSITIGMGQPWQIKTKLLSKFNGKIVDFMGIPLPQYRGGAHYSWMILNNNRVGGCFLQNINSNTHQSLSDTGYFYMDYKYVYPKSLKIPKDYFKYSTIRELFFLKKLNEDSSIHFPRLISSTNSFIDWSNSAEEIVRFINAFSDPYTGAISFFKKKKIFFKDAKLIKKNNFHSYTAGLIVNITDTNILIAAKEGVINIRDVKNEKKNNLIKKLKVGDRFSTTEKYLLKSKIHPKF